MKEMKKITAACLAAILAAGRMAGCGSDGQGSDSKSGSETGGTTGSTTTVDPDNPWMIGDPNDPIELTVFLNHTWYSTESFTGVIPDEITKRTGIRLVPTKATDYTQLGVMASSGELPDLVFTSQMLDTLSGDQLFI